MEKTQPEELEPSQLSGIDEQITFSADSVRESKKTNNEQGISLARLRTYGIALAVLSYGLFVSSSAGWASIVNLFGGAIVYGVALILFLIVAHTRGRTAENGILYIHQAGTLSLVISFSLVILTSFGDCGDASGMVFFFYRILHHITDIWNHLAPVFNATCLGQVGMYAVFYFLYPAAIVWHILNILFFIFTIRGDAPLGDHKPLPLKKPILSILIFTVCIVAAVLLLDERESNAYFQAKYDGRDQQRMTWLAAQNETMKQLSYPVEIVENGGWGGGWDCPSAPRLSLRELIDRAEEIHLARPAGGRWNIWAGYEYNYSKVNEKVCKWNIVAKVDDVGSRVGYSVFGNISVDDATGEYRVIFNKE